MLNNYWKPTPIRMRKLGDSLLGLSTTLGSYTAFTGNAKAAGVIFIVGTIGKFLTNLFKEGE